MKVLIIGIDGGTWDVLDDFVLSHYMPNMKRLREGGASGVLSSTVPAITPAAWTSATSGCSPHIHGLMDFRYYSFQDNILKLARSDRVKVPSMWYYLGQAGYKTASLNVPFTYPVYPINGVMVAGLGCPGTSAAFTYPSDFKDKILAKMPDYGLGLGPEEIDKRSGGLGRNKEEFLANLKAIERRMEQRVELVELVGEHEPMDILMVQFQEVDLIEHLGWPYVSAKTRDEYPWYRDRLFETFARLDEHIGELVKLIDLQKDLLVMLSDHGFGPMDYKIHPNKLLCDWGFIKRSGVLDRAVRRTRRNLLNLKKVKLPEMTIDLKHPVEWSRTRAMMLLRPLYGSVFANVRGRQPGGCVEAGAEYEDLLGELKEKFEAVTNPENGEKVFKQVITPRELWAEYDPSIDLYGDLLLIQKDNYRISASLKQGINTIEAAAGDSLTSSWHWPNGIYVLNGAGIKSNCIIDAAIVDIAPSIYAWLEMAVPAEVNGSVILGAFEGSPNVKKNSQINFPDSFKEKTDSDLGTESPEEQERLARQLKALGYLD